MKLPDSTLQKKILFILFLIPAGIAVFAQPMEEFHGPLGGWANVKGKFNIKADGKTDNTKDLQKAIDGLADRFISYESGPGSYSVIYLPAGTYCISSTLELKGKIGISIVGEDPSRTFIKWTGKKKDTMFWANGSAYFKISRLSWDPNGRDSLEAIGIHWKDRWNRPESRSYATLNIEISDCWFKDGFLVGIGGGSSPGEFTGSNDSEITIRRCKFAGCKRAGICIEGYNALDYWIWDSQFVNCTIGIYNNSGNFHAYRCYFEGSKDSDTRNKNGYYTSVRWSYSQNSNALSIDEGVSCNPFKRIFQGNVINAPGQIPIEFYHLGRITLMDNYFGENRFSKLPYTVNQGSWCPGIYSLLAIHNRFRSRQAINLAKEKKVEYIVQKDSLKALPVSSGLFLKKIPSAPLLKKRTVFEIAPGSPVEEIQLAVDKAAKLNNHSIVHLQAGKYTFEKSLIIPPMADLQLLGDGLLYATEIRRGGQLSKKGLPFLVVKGPTCLVLRDMQFGMTGLKSDDPAIVFENVDQPGSRAIIDQLYSHADTSLFVFDYDQLIIQKENSFFSDGNYIRGGKLVEQGKGSSKVISFGGQFAGLETRRNAQFIARDIWWEGNDRIPLDLKGEGRITIDGVMVAPRAADSLPSIKVNQFKGAISLMSIYLQGGLYVEPANADLKLFAWDINFYHKMNPVDFLKPGVNYQALLTGFTSQCFDKRSICSQPPQSFGEYKSNVSDVNRFVNVMTKDDRTATPLQYVKLKQGVSNIYISRVSVLSGNRGISFVK